MTGEVVEVVYKTFGSAVVRASSLRVPGRAVFVLVVVRLLYREDS